MKTIFRTVLVLFVFVTIYIFTYFAITDIAPKTIIIKVLSHVVSLLIAVLSVILVWKKTAHVSNDLAIHIIVGGLIVEPIGFSLGFFASMIMTHTDNHGPLAGVFIAAPIGFIIGLISGWIYWNARGNRQLY